MANKTHYASADDMALHMQQERDEAAHTVSIWGSRHRGVGKRTLYAVGASDANGHVISTSLVAPGVRGYDYVPH